MFSSRNPSDKFKIVNAKVLPEEAKKFEELCKKNRTSQSEVLRSLIEMFVKGDIKITKLIGR